MIKSSIELMERLHIWEHYEEQIAVQFKIIKKMQIIGGYFSFSTNLAQNISF